MDLEIRRAVAANVPDLARLMVKSWLDAHHGQMPEHLWKKRREEWTPSVSANGWMRTIRNIERSGTPGEILLVAFLDETLVGLAHASLGADGSIADLTALYVSIDLQRRGVGSKLLAAVQKHFLGQNAKSLKIGVLDSNAPARGFYEARGARYVGSRDFDEEGTSLPEAVYRIGLE